MGSLVMVVEDDDDVREDLAFLIAGRGYDVETAANGQEALDKLQSLVPERSPCLMVLDLMMPVMDGWELRRKLLADPEHAGVAVVLLSGVADLQAQAEALQVAAYLTKPIDLQRLFALIGQYCDPA